MAEPSIAALADLVAQCSQLRSYDGSGLSDIVLSITGFYGAERELIKSLCSSCHVRYEPSLVKSWTTHLVCRSPEAAQRSDKLAKAGLWGVPVVSLQWLLDSVGEGAALPVGAYLVRQAQALEEGAAEQQEQLLDLRLLQAPLHRPSSVASNAQPVFLPDSAAQGGWPLSPPLRTALDPVDNVIMQLRAVTVSPAAKAAGWQELAQDEGDSSPGQQSLSFQHMVDGHLRSPTGSPAAVSSRPTRKAWGGAACPAAQPSAAVLPFAHASPMLASPPGAARQQQQQQCGAMEPPFPWSPSCSPISDAGTTSSAGRSLSSMSGCTLGAGSTANGRSSSPAEMAAAAERRTSSSTAVRSPPALHEPASAASPIWGGQPEDMEDSLGGGEAVALQQGGSPTFSGGQCTARSVDSEGWPPAASPAGDSAAEQQQQQRDGAQVQDVTGATPDAQAAVSGSPSSSASLHLPPSNECQITYRRPHQQQQQRGGEAAGKPRAIADWTDDDSEDGFPTPQDARARRKAQEEDAGPVIVARVPPAPAPQLGDDVALKVLKAAPRGNCVREHHGLGTLRHVQFAEQVQLARLGLVLSTKDKKTAVKLRGAAGDGDGSGDSSAAAGPAIGEPQTFYKLPDGVWYLEYCQLYTAEQAERLAADRGTSLALPVGFDRINELLKSTARVYAALDDIIGSVAVRRVKQGGTMLRLKGGTAAAPSYFWRTALDPAAVKLVTDRPAKDFVAMDGLQL